MSNAIFTGTVKQPLKRRPRKGIFQTHDCLMQVKRIAECSAGGEHSAVLLICIKLPHDSKILVLASSSDRTGTYI